MHRVRSPPPWWLGIFLRIAATRPGAWLLARTLPSYDRLLQRLSAGRLSLTTLLWKLNVPIVELTTNGAKTGKERTVPVLGIPGDEELIVVASNWGRTDHPAWYHNLKANPDVKVTYDGRTERYAAREVTGDELREYWEQVSDVNPGLETYQQRAGERRIPIVVLTPTDGSR